MNIRRAALAIVAGLGLAVPAAPAAAVAASGTQAEIDAVLAGHPGARQTARDTVRFANGVELKVGVFAEEDCPADALCLWDDQQYTGQLEIIYPYVCDYGVVINLKDTGFNDRASSWKDNTTRRVGVVYWDYDTNGGLLWRMFPMQKAPTLPAEFNDEASSVTCYNLF